MTIPPEAITDLAKLAYDTWQRARGVPGASTWEMLPAKAKEGWDATATAVVADVLARVERGVADGTAEVIAQAVAAERDRIRQLAVQHHALYRGSPSGDWSKVGLYPFADLLDGAP